MKSKAIQFDFSQKNVLIVGGSRGFGAALVSSFVKSNANVFYISRNAHPHNEGSHIQVDLSDTQALLLALEKNKKNKIDILINCAAINYAKRHDEIDIYEWEEVFRVNLSSIFLISNAVLPLMKKNNYGKIVNVSSIAGRHRSIVSGIHYVTSKAALIGYTRQLAYEVGEWNINVNVVCPSQTKTEMYDSTMTKDKERQLLETIPIKRIGTVSEQIAPIMFLCSDASSYMTGSVVDVNGGQI
jgi:3-oxoacyl-[acyl-carrier protein] reductase